MKRSPLKKKSKDPIAALTRKAVKVFNAYIRARDMLILKGKCYTCDEPGSEAGHFIHGSNGTKFIEEAVHLQCGVCNRHLSGNLVIYTLRMIADYGENVVREIERKGHGTHRFHVGELEDIIAKYQQKLEDVDK